jgi:hypothetical protein
MRKTVYICADGVLIGQGILQMLAGSNSLACDADIPENHYDEIVDAIDSGEQSVMVDGVNYDWWFSVE